MLNYVQTGDVLTVPAPAALAAGQGAFVGSIFGVASTTAALGDDVALKVTGVFELPKDGTAIAIGAAAYWNAADAVATATAPNNVKIGVVTVAAAATDTTAIVRLNGVF